MPRPEFPQGIILPVEVIRAIRQKQDTYDRDPETYERWERVKEEQRLEEERLAYEYEREMEARIENGNQE